jgi:hypothetical protein
MTRARSVSLGFLAVLTGSLALLVSGCRQPTEIVVVVDTDLTIGSDFDVIQFGFGTTAFQSEFASAAQLPATLGVVPSGSDAPSPGGPGGANNLTLVVTAARFGQGSIPGNGVPSQNAPVVTRGVTGLRFVDGQERMLFVPLFRRCMCQGTSCPNLTDPDCKDITTPALADFDEDHLPRITAP